MSFDSGRLASWQPLACRGKQLFAFCAASLALAIGAARARADFEIATFTNVSPGQVVSIPVNGTTESGWAGFYNFTNGSGVLNGKFSGFCIDIAQDISTGDTVNFGTAALQDAPTPGKSMGALRANLIRELWYNNYAASGTSDSNAAAFQIALWEIINETNTNANGTLNLDLRSGAFWATDSDSSTVTKANQWLSQLDLAGTGPMAGSLLALTSSDHQDYVVQAAPAPSGLLLGTIGGLGLAMASGVRWQKRRMAVTPAT